MKNSKTIIFSVLYLLAVAGCKKDILNPPPENQFTDAAVWNNLSLATLFLNETYNGVPSGFERGFYLLASCTDEAENGYVWTYSQDWNQADFTPSVNYPRFDVPWGGAPTQWETGFQYIRRANDFLSRIDAVPGDDSTKRVLKGEAFFLRALFYHQLVKLYGGVPIIDHPQTLNNIDSLQVKRNTKQECVDFIIKDLDSAAAVLPDVRTGADVGRASRAAALALKGRQLLYAERWADAAAVCKQVMQIPGYSLFPDYESMFWAANNNNSESIFAKQYISLSKSNAHTHPSNQFNALYTMGGWGATQPTQNMVDEYEMVDGLSYDQSPLYNPNAPYKNRDPRFAASILYDGTTWNGREIELKQGGKEGMGTANDATKTGYNLRKFMDPVAASTNVNDGHNNWIILRLGEVYLNYAEAQNEAAGPDQSVYDAVNAIRQRPSVKMPPLASGLDQNAMREKIRHERTVEMAFEEQRFFDIRRWKNTNGQLLADSILNTPVYGMRISNDRSTYTRFKWEDRHYLPRNLYLPIPQSEMNKNPHLEQNPGY